MKRFWLSILVLSAVCSSALAAGAYDIKEMTPQVKAALEGRKSRYAELKAYKKKGLIGETNRGYIKALVSAPGVKEIVEVENADRKVIYLAIVEQNGLRESELLTVEKVFAQVQRDKAEAGEKIQDEGGAWLVK